MTLLQGTIARRADWVLSILWHRHQTCVQLPPILEPVVAVPGIMVHTVNDSVKAANLGHLVSAVDGNKGSVAHGTQCEGVRCFHGCGAIERAWISVASPLPGVQTVCCTRVPAWDLHDQPLVF